MVKKNNKVLLGLSGGVDSTAAALLLKEKGYHVTGYFFDVTGNNDKAKTEAKETARQLDIELICDDVSEIFKETVIDNFCREYLNGRTPNPCIICNPNIKFRKLIENADKIGADYIATGHYCRIKYDSDRERYFVRQGLSKEKDQSYMLYRLDQDVLKRLIFPLGEIKSKDTTRTLARKKNLQNAEKKDSQEICFIESDYASYIESQGFSSEEGYFVDKSGKILGRHKGILNYTIGQRKGLGIALGKPAFVTEIDAKGNRIVLGENEDLFSDRVECEDFFFTAGHPKEYDDMEVMAKVRYSAKLEPARIKVYDKKIITTFETPQRAATPGQSIVFYIDDIVIGGGFIK